MMNPLILVGGPIPGGGQGANMQSEPAVVETTPAVTTTSEEEGNGSTTTTATTQEAPVPAAAPTETVQEGAKDLNW